MASLLQQLFLAFKDQSNNVDLVDLLNYINQTDQRTQNSCQILIAKLKRIIEGRPSLKVNGNKFYEILSMDLKIKQNFDLVFEHLTGDQFITYEQLERLNNQLSLGFVRQQLQGMIGSVSPKSDRVSKAELYDFIRNK